MSVQFKINPPPPPPVYVDATARGKSRPVFFDVKPQLTGLNGSVGGGYGRRISNSFVDSNQLGSFMSKTDGLPNHVPREAFTGSIKGGVDGDNQREQESGQKVGCCVVLK